MENISVIVPVGPKEHHTKYLAECIESIQKQLLPTDDLVLVSDGGSVSLLEYYEVVTNYMNIPWAVGPGAAWNIGVAIADNEWCLLMGADDLLKPGCIEAVREVISSSPDPYGYYNLTCETSNGKIIDLHNNAAVVSKTLWGRTGGFPIEGFAAMDALFIAGMLGACPQHLHQIAQGTPLYWVREHPDQYSYINGYYHGAIIAIRNAFTAKVKQEWKF